MGLWSSLFGRKALTGTPQVVDALNSRQTNLWPLLGGGARQRITEAFTTAKSAQLSWLYESSPAVRSVLDLIVRNMAQLDLRLYEELSESEREPRPDHPAALSMRYPNETETSDHFIRGLLKDFLIFDDALALKWRDRTNSRVTMYRIPFARVEIMGSQTLWAEKYRIHRDDGTWTDVEDPSDAIHWRGENPRDPRTGLSRLDTLRSVIAEDVALQAAIVELAKSGLVEPSWVYRPLEAPQWSNEARDRFEEDLTNRLRRINKTPPVFEEGMELRPSGVSPRDAQMLDVRKYVQQQVAGLYGVPLGMLGLSDKIEESRSVFLSETLQPLCEEFARWLNHGLLVTEYGLTEYCFEFNLDEKLMGDERVKALTSASGRPVFTTNEARALLNLKPIKGGDELVTPGNVIVGDKPSPMVMPIQNPTKPSQEGDYRAEPEKAMDGIYRNLAKAGKVEERDSGEKQLLITSEPRLMADMARQKRNVDKVRPVFDAYYENQQRVLLDGKARAEVKAANTEEWNNRLAKRIEKVAREIVEHEAGIYVARLGGDDFDMGQVKNYLKEQAIDAAVGINEATQRDINEVGVVEALKRCLDQRAEIAASSIGVRATVFARQEAAKQAPFPEMRMKTWIPNTDRHAELGGVTVPLNSSWGGLEPGSDANCQCSMTIT